MHAPSPQPQAPSKPRAGGERAHRQNLVVNTLLAGLKLTGGLVTGSPSLLADGTHSLADTATGTVAWLSFRWASLPADEDHHYGHGKAEAAAGLFVGLVLIVAGVGVVWEATRDGSTSYTGYMGQLAMGAALISVLANEWLYRVTLRAGKELGSHSLLAMARDNRADVLTGVLVLVGVGASMVGAGWVEPFAAAVIGATVGYMGFESTKHGLDVLMDRAPDPELRARAQALAEQVPGVVAVQRVDVHPLGATMRLDMEVSVEGDLSVSKGHEIAHEVERAVTRGEEGVVEVAVHVNPA
jgi:cation diffusion facilitator family transporter